MADGVTIKVKGLEEVQRRMLMLPVNVDRRVARRSVLAGAVPIRDEARRQAPYWHGPVSKGHPPPGTLQRAIIVKFVPEESKNGRTYYIVTVRHGKRYQRQGKSGKLSQDAFYWWWVEFKKAKNMNSKPYLRPAYELRKVEAANKIIATLNDGVMEEAGRG